LAFAARGYAKSEQGDYAGAIKDYSKAIEINPEYGAAYAGRGLVKIFLGQNNDGWSDLSKASELSLLHSVEFKVFIDEVYNLLQMHRS
jgi:tetratricopeptide (TPR) repeat protein